jgi:GNAT superfamily N-acetyltransferase
VGEIVIKPTRYGAPAARTLITAAMAVLGERSGDPAEAPLDGGELAPPHGIFMVAYRDGLAVGCGAWRTFGDSEELAEVKIMYVSPDARRCGVGRAILRALEQSAEEQGRKTIVLQTGVRQVDAVALVHAAGYMPIDDLGFYRDAPGARCFGRDL